MMTGDIVVALGPATVRGATLLGQNCHQRVGAGQRLVLVPGRSSTPEGDLHLGKVHLPPCRSTATVLALQAVGSWGYLQGVNEHGLAGGVTCWDSVIERKENSPAGTDLLRLVLERCHSAFRAVELLTDLISRHGQGSGAGSYQAGRDALFLLADPREAYVLEAAGSFWAWQQIQQVRAVSNVAVIRHDWDRLAPGLYDHASLRGWCPQDGNKLDFVGTVGLDPIGQASALRRWGRATWLLERQAGRLDDLCFRRLLSDHYEGASYEADPLLGTRAPVPLCRHGIAPGDLETSAALIIELPRASGNEAEVGSVPRPDPGPIMCWCCLGPPCLSLFFPLFLEGELPAAWTRSDAVCSVPPLARSHQKLRRSLGLDARRWLHLRDAVARLQVRFDQEAKDLVTELQQLIRHDQAGQRRRLMESLMHSHVELFASLEQECLQGASRADNQPLLLSSDP